MSTSADKRTIPVLDFSRYQADPASRKEFLEDLRHAARDIGFFYLTGHGIAQSLIDDVLAASRRFFALPDKEKLQIEMVNSPHFRGYNRVGQELTKGQRDWREQVDIGSEAPALHDPKLPAWTRLQGPNQWPVALPELKPLLLEWQDRLTDLSTRLLKTFAIVLEQDENAFETIYAGTPNHLIKIIRYPGRDSTESEQGVGAHKDSGFLTLLLQERQKGLQVEAADGGWIDAEPRAGTFVVNIGELLEMATDGYLKATVHRVVTPPAGTDRLSVAFFLGAPFDAEIPLLDLAPHLKAQASGVTRDPQNPLYRNSGQNALKSRLRSHPDVARRHHADLLAAQARVEAVPVA